MASLNPKTKALKTNSFIIRKYFAWNCFGFLLTGSTENQKHFIYFIDFKRLLVVIGNYESYFCVHFSCNEPLTLMMITDRNNKNKAYNLMRNSSGTYCSFVGIQGKELPDSTTVKKLLKNQLRNFQINDYCSHKLLSIEGSKK